ncbi:MAG: hypothetical protein HKN73_12395 [Gemmatimonadetes bacterium]|nr:hypothetical protein [Gemmatimonadota bacterium]
MLEGLSGPRDDTIGSSALDRFTAAWAERLAQELGDEGPGVQLGFGVGAIRSDAEIAEARGGFARAIADARISPSLGGWIDGTVSTQSDESRIQAGGLSWTPGGVQVLAGRLRPAVRTGQTAVLLSGETPLDGLMVASARPFRFPGALSRIGTFQGHLFVSPFHETPTVSDAWFTAYGLGWSPVPSLSFGVARTIRFGGEGLAPFTASNIWNMIAFGGGNSSFDDSQGELSFRARLRLGDFRLGLYGALAFEDLKAITEDPALTAGFSIPVITDAGMFSLGYEFLGIGPRGIWCGCDAVSHSWYTQREYGPYATEDGLLGAALGGYGAGHYLSASFWSTPHPISVRTRFFLEDRGADNLLAARWPDERRGVRVQLGLGPWRGLLLSLGGTATSTEVGTEGGVDVFVQALSLGRLLSRP